MLVSISRLLQGIPLPWWKALAVVVLLVIMAQSGARLFWLLMPSPQTTQTMAYPPVYKQVDRKTVVSVDIDALKVLPLFGRENTPSENIAVAISPDAELASEETQLSLILQGVVDSSKPTAARAIIAHQGKQHVYAPGDSLPGGHQVTLTKILHDRVILNNAGRYESLRLYEQPEESEQVVASHHETTSSPAQNAVQDIAQTLGQDSAAVERTLADVIRVTIAREGNQLIGYRIQAGRDRELFDRFGFQANDIITSVNGVSLSDPKKAMAVYREIRSVRAASFELLRNGEALTLDVTLDDNNV